MLFLLLIALGVNLGAVQAICSSYNNQLDCNNQAGCAWEALSTQCICGSSVPVDLLIVMDSSGSVGSSNFGTAKTFVKNMIDTLGANSRVGLVNFAGSGCNSPLGTYTCGCNISDLDPATTWCAHVFEAYWDSECKMGNTVKAVCANTRLQVQLEHSLADQQYHVGNAWNTVKNKVDGIPYHGGATYTAMALRVATDELKLNGRASAQKRIFLITDGVPFSDTFPVVPCDADNAAEWNAITNMTSLGFKLHLLKVGSFSDSDLQCLLEKDTQNNVINVIDISSFNQLSNAIAQLTATSCPTLESVAVTEVKPEPAYQGNGIPVNDARVRFVELWNRGPAIDFSTTTISMTGLFTGELNDVTMSNYVWPTGTFLVLYQDLFSNSPPFCRQCSCVHSLASQQLLNANGECDNAKYVALPMGSGLNQFQHVVANAGNPMKRWTVRLQLGSSLLDDATHETSGGNKWVNIPSGYTFRRSVASYNDLPSQGSNKLSWTRSCLVYGTPGDSPLPDCNTASYPSTPPTYAPSLGPSSTPSTRPSGSPTPKPTKPPIVLTAGPSGTPTTRPTMSPSTPRPTSFPSSSPSKSPTLSPTSACQSCQPPQVATTCAGSQLTSISSGTDIVLCCTGANGRFNYVRLVSGASSGTCELVPLLDPPPTCTITIQPNSNLGVALIEVGSAAWAYPSGYQNDPNMAFNLYLQSSGGNAMNANPINGLGQSGVQTKDFPSDVVRRTIYVEAQYLDEFGSGQILFSNRTLCIYATSPPNPAPVPPPTPALPATQCTFAEVVKNSANQVFVRWNLVQDIRATGIAVYYGTLISIVGTLQTSLTVTYTNVLTSGALIQIGVLTQANPTTADAQALVTRTNCTITTRFPTSRPSDHPSFSPTQRPTSAPSKTPSAAPVYPTRLIDVCQCHRMGSNQYTVSATITPGSAPYKLELFQNSEKIATSDSTQPNTDFLGNNMQISQASAFDNTACILKLYVLNKPGGSYGLAESQPCTVKTNDPTNTPSQAPSSSPSRGPTSTPSTAGPSKSPTMRPTCKVDLPTCVVTLSGGTAGGTVSLSALVNFNGDTAPTGMVHLEESINGGAYINVESFGIAQRTKNFAAGSRDPSATFRIRVSGSSADACYSSGGGPGSVVAQTCSRKSAAPTKSPTFKPTGQPTFKPTYVTAGVYIVSEHLDPNVCATGTERCQCSGQTSATCTVNTVNYGARTVVAASVAESNATNAVFNVQRYPKVSTPFPFDVFVTYGLYLKPNSTELQGLGTIPAVSDAQVGTLASLADVDQTISGVALLAGEVKIPDGSDSATLEFRFLEDNSVDPDENAFLVIKSVRVAAPSAKQASDNTMSSGDVMYPAVVGLKVVAPVGGGSSFTSRTAGEMPNWVWAIIAGAILLLAAVGFMAYRKYRSALATKAKAAEIDREIADLDAEDDPMALDANDVNMNPLATGVKGAEYANLGDTFDAARIDARNNVELANVDVDRVNFRSEFGAVKPAGAAGAGAGGAGSALMMGGGGGYAVSQTTVVRQSYVVQQG